MTETMNITDALKTMVFDLWGNKYRTKPVTKSGEAELREIEEQRREADTDAEDVEVQLIRLQARRLAVCTEPIDGAPADVEALIIEKYENDELVTANLVRFATEAENATANPFADQRG